MAGSPPLLRGSVESITAILNNCPRSAGRGRGLRRVVTRLQRPFRVYLIERNGGADLDLEAG